MKYQLATFGNDTIVEGVGIDAATFAAIKGALPADVQAQVIGWRRVASVSGDRSAR